jgi:hypothetical protein
MKRIWLVVAFVLITGAAWVFQQSFPGADPLLQARSAAYRDGMYQGLLAAKRGSGLHVAIGRWSTDGDRASFVAGYELGHAQGIAASDNVSHATSAAFRDGLFLGTAAAKRGERAHISAGRWSTDGDRTLFTKGYREGYPESVMQIAAKSHRLDKTD